MNFVCPALPYYLHRQEVGNPSIQDSWTRITAEQFNEVLDEFVHPALPISEQLHLGTLLHCHP